MTANAKSGFKGHGALTAYKKYTGFVSLGVQRQMNYRFSFLMSFLAAFVQPLVMYCVWMAVYRGRPLIADFSLRQMITYLFISQGVTNLYGFNTVAERRVYERVQSGDLALDLVRPVDFGAARFAEVLGQLGLQVATVCAVLVPLKLLIPGFSGPASPGYFLAFLFSVFLGFLTMFSLGMMIGFITFWLHSYWGIYYMRKSVVDFLSGAVVPLSLLPPWMVAVSGFLPFRNIVYVPTMIYLGRYSPGEALFQIMLQLVWGATLWFLARRVYAAAMKKVTIHGG